MTNVIQFPKRETKSDAKVNVALVAHLYRIASSDDDGNTEFYDALEGVELPEADNATSEQSKKQAISA